MRPRSIPNGGEVLVALALVLVPGVARADDIAKADQLFTEGKELMQARRFEEAAVKFAATRELDPKATGALLNLALCHEALDKRASAWVEFRIVAMESAGKREDRVAAAREHEAKLLPKLSYVTIAVDASNKPALAIDLDAKPIDPAAWGTEIPIDPGPHVVHATAPGRVAATQAFTIELAEAQRREVRIGPLAVLDKPAPPPGAPPPDHRTLGYVLGGIGIASVATGAVFGILATNKNHDAKNACPDDDSRCPTPSRADDARSFLTAAKTDALVADVTIGAGALLVLAGAWFVFTAPTSKPPPLAASRGTMLLRGVW